MTGIFILLAVGLGAIAWWRLLRGKELARLAAGHTCKQHGLVLMDDTVILDSVQLKRKDPVRAWGLKYRFDFAHRGLLRHGGTVLIAPGQRTTVIIDTDNGQLIEQL